jgi:hypothetical protein
MTQLERRVADGRSVSRIREPVEEEVLVERR